VVRRGGGGGVEKTKKDGEGGENVVMRRIVESFMESARVHDIGGGCVLFFLSFK